MFLRLAVGAVADPSALERRFGRRYGVPATAPEAGAPRPPGSPPTAEPSLVTRFASREAALTAARHRPEAPAPWSSASSCLAPPLTVVETDDVTVVGGHDPTAAGFVQVMRARVGDRGRFEALESEIGPAFLALRPDFVAGYRAWSPTARWRRSTTSARSRRRGRGSRVR